jgi:hypothetical protein
MNNFFVDSFFKGKIGIMKKSSQKFVSFLYIVIDIFNVYIFSCLMTINWPTKKKFKNYINYLKVGQLVVKIEHVLELQSIWFDSYGKQKLF